MIRIKGIYWTEYTNNDIMIISMISESKEAMGRLDKPQLNTYLEKIIQDDINEGCGYFLDDVLACHIADNPGLYPNGITDQMTLALNYLEEHRPELPEGAYDHTRYRALCVFDQFKNRPDELRDFLNDPLVKASVTVQNSDFFSTAVPRWINKNGSQEGIVQLVQYGKDLAEDPADYACNLVQQISDPDMLEIVMGNIEGELPLQVADKLRDRLNKLKIKQRLAQEALETERNRREAREAAEERKRVFYKRLDEVVKTISSDPDKYFGEIVDGGFAVDIPDADIYSEVVKSCCANAYLSASWRQGSKSQWHERAVSTLSDVLHGILTEIDEEEQYPGSEFNNYPHYLRYVSEYLGLIIPDTESYRGLMRKYPSLKENDKMYNDWKDSLIDMRLTERALAEEIDPELINSLRQADVCRLEIDIKGQPYIKYDNRADLYDDLYKYFVDYAGNLFGRKTARKLELRDGDDYFRSQHSLEFVQLSHENDSALRECVIAPLNKFMKDPAFEQLQPGERKILTIENGQCDHYLDRHSKNTFRHYEIHIGVVKQPNGGCAYELYHTPRIYNSDVWNRHTLPRIAAFVDKPIEYSEPTQATVKMTTLTGAQLYRASREEDYRERQEKLYEQLKSSRKPDIINKVSDPYESIRLIKPDAVPSPGVRKYDYSYWRLPYDGTPNHTTARVLQRLIGTKGQLYKNDSGQLVPVRPDLSNLSEATKEFCAETAVGSGELESLNVYVSINNFKVSGISSKQARQLKALEHLM